jgi:phosphopantetheinyl transferase
MMGVSQPSFSQCRLGNVHIFLLDFSGAIAHELEAAATRLLGATEQALLNKLTLQRRRIEWLAGRIVAKAALQASRLREGLAACAFRDIQILPARANSGPVVSPLGGHISISHSGTMAAAAHASAPIGVDIERFRHFGSTAVEHFVSEYEARLLGTITPDSPMLTLLWSVKEATIKSRHADTLAAMKEVQWAGWRDADTGAATGAAIVQDQGKTVPQVHAGFWRGHALAVASRPAEGLTHD